VERGLRTFNGGGGGEKATNHYPVKKEIRKRLNWVAEEL
jgi:hypothetical protein